MNELRLQTVAEGPFMSAGARFQSTLPSPLPGVSAAGWARLVAALDVQPIRAVSESGGFGAFDMRPRRLVELGYARNLRYARTPEGRQVYACDFAPPWTLEAFLRNPLSQYRALARSLGLYHELLRAGDIARPAGVSLAGALAILHRGGRGALRKWPDVFSDTRALFEAAQGAF